jgi:osmotically-inducible protein OsmY
MVNIHTLNKIPSPMKTKAIVLLAFSMVLMLSSCAPSDQQISEAVQNALTSNASLSPVSASVKDGVVTLSGEVESDELKSMAASAVTGVKGVKSVVNSITVKPKGPSPEELKKMADDALLSKVNGNFATYKIEGITATVSDSVVTLTGDVKRANLQNVMKAAMESGAAKVENQMTIK